MTPTISLIFASFITLKLTPDNYPLCHEKMLVLAESQDMVELLIGENETCHVHQCHSRKDINKQRPRKTNFRRFSPVENTRSSPKWMDHRDTYRRNFGYWPWLISINLESFEWSICPSQYLAEHLRKFKSICDILAAIDNLIPDKKKDYSLLANLGPKYESFQTTMLKPLCHPTQKLFHSYKDLNNEIHDWSVKYSIICVLWRT